MISKPLFSGFFVFICLTIIVVLNTMESNIILLDAVGIRKRDSKI